MPIKLDKLQAREDERQVEAKLTQVQQKILQGRRSIDDPGTIIGKKANGKKPNSPPRKPAGKRPVSLLSQESFVPSCPEKSSKEDGKGSESGSSERDDESKEEPTTDGLKGTPKKGKGKKQINLMNASFIYLFTFRRKESFCLTRFTKSKAGN